MHKLITRLSARKPDIMGKDAYFVSAVLLPLLEKQGQKQILFEVRAANMKTQPGEICFPGGRVESYEQHAPYQAAIRETTEELGINRENIKLIGPLDILPSPMGRLIYPYAGYIMTDNFQPNPEEVAQIFAVPLDFLLNNPPKIFYTEVAVRYSSDFPFHKIPPEYKPGWQKRWSFPDYCFEYGKYFIWGLTAKILYNFLELFYPEKIKYHL